MFCEDLRRGGYVIECCACHNRFHQDAQSIHENMLFSPGQVRCAFGAPFAARVRCLDALTVHNRCARRHFATRRRSRLLAQAVHSSLPCPVVAPAGKLLVRRALGRQVVGQNVLLAAPATQRENLVDHFSQIDLSRTTGSIGSLRRQQQFQQTPLIVR
jgi:hypothetical protein